MTILITGGCGFIGSNFITNWLKKNNELLINIDKISYSSKNNYIIHSLKNKNYKFFKLSINNEKKLYKIFTKYKPRIAINFAAESHVDRSIKKTDVFFKTNVLGTLNLLEISRKYQKGIINNNFLFIHFSTDEVYGDLKSNQKPFTETSKYYPNNPYSASKASSDHIVRSFYKTYNFPAIVINCSNNYGKFQNTEKLIPLTIKKLYKNQKIPVYGNGNQIRDWLFVNDTIQAINKIIKNGKIGETYNIGGNNETKNINLINIIIQEYAKIDKKKDITKLKKLITFVDDRPGHDKRYSVNFNKIKNKLKWHPQNKRNLNVNIQKTIKWYLNNLNFLLKN